MILIKVIFFFINRSNREYFTKAQILDECRLYDQLPNRYVDHGLLRMVFANVEELANGIDHTWSAVDHSLLVSKRNSTFN